MVAAVEDIVNPPTPEPQSTIAPSWPWTQCYSNAKCLKEGPVEAKRAIAVKKPARDGCIAQECLRGFLKTGKPYMYYDDGKSWSICGTTDDGEELVSGKCRERSDKSHAPLWTQSLCTAPHRVYEPKTLFGSMIPRVTVVVPTSKRRHTMHGLLDHCFFSQV